MTKVVICTREQTEFKKKVEEYNLPNIELYAPESEQELISHISDAEVIFANPILLSKYINSAKNVKWVQSSFAGIDALNNTSLQKKYTLTNMRETYGEIMAEYVMWYILMLAKNMLWNIENQKNKTWWQKSYPSIVGKKIWIMGIGSIGRIIAIYAKTMWMTVYGYANTYREQHCIDKVFTKKTQDEFLEDLDYVVSVLPNTKETQGIVDREFLSKLPPKAVLINVWRGANINEHDLIWALENKNISWAVLDVFQTEPLPKDSEFWSLDNVYVTPHVSWYVEDNSKIIETFAENYKRYVSGKDLVNTVDFNKGY